MPEQGDMMALIKQVVQDFLDLLPASQGRSTSEPAQPTKRGSEPGIMSDDSDDFTLVSPFV